MSYKGQKTLLFDEQNLQYKRFSGLHKKCLTRKRNLKNFIKNLNKRFEVEFKKKLLCSSAPFKSKI